MEKIYDLHCGDALEVLATFPDECVDTIITDPPYGIGFMGKEWDVFSPSVVAYNRSHMDRNHLTNTNPNLKGRGNWCGGAAIHYDRSLKAARAYEEWAFQFALEFLRVLKPGGYYLTCMGPRTEHRLACGIEDAGFEIRDKLLWLFGKGMPKSTWLNDEKTVGTGLKPMYEPILVARKPFDGTARACYAAHGTAGLNIEDCRVETTGRALRVSDKKDTLASDVSYSGLGSKAAGSTTKGRWPPNVLLDELAVEMVDEQSPVTRSRSGKPRTGRSGPGGGITATGAEYDDHGGASRFFYCAKTTTKEREAGCDHLPLVTAGEMTGGRKEGSAGLGNPRAGAGRTAGRRNHHPTVKPIAVMRWLVRLASPPGGVVLDPFTGSGSTAVACVHEDRSFVGVEREAPYVDIANARLAHALGEAP